MAKTANARPTKSLILEALTTDIELADAILDLLDNSVDGARRTGPPNNWSKFDISIIFDRSGFTITDNCGGIDAGTAMEYAFRFGRPGDRKPEHGLLGIYGVGMKRAIFKMGNRLRVKSTTRTSSFEIDEDLENWRDDEDLWEFEFKDFVEKGTFGANQVGTTIEVKKLFEGISQDFSSPHFQSELIKKAAKAHKKALEQNLRITINGIPLQTAGFSLLHSDSIQPAYGSERFNSSASPITVQLFAGLGESQPTEAGWYVFCNGRMILEADQTARTVWGETGNISIPKIHNQFARFRGFAFFECDDQKRLPWTSTKASIDQSSSVYRKVRSQMVEMTRPVITFLNELDKEKDAETRPRHDSVKRAAAKPLADFVTPRDATFKYTGSTKEGPETGRISYSKLKTEIDRAKEKLDVATSREVGEKTFEYWYRYEVRKR